MMSSVKVRNVGVAVIVVGLLVFLGGHLLNYVGARTGSGDTGPDIGAGLVMMLGEFITALGVAVAVGYGLCAAMRERTLPPGVPLAMVGVLLTVEGAALALREHDVAGQATVWLGLAIVILGLAIAAARGIGDRSGGRRGAAPRA